MGSLSSRPKVPAQATPPAVVYVQAEPQDSTANASDDSAAEQLSAAQQREQNLLRRSRGRLGTVKTGLSGLLKTLQPQEPRKTLLGE